MNDSDSEGDLRAVRIPKVAGPEWRFPHQRQADDVHGMASVGNRVHLRGRPDAAAVGRRLPHAGELGDQDGVVFVVAEMVVVGGARLEAVRRETPLRVEGSAQGDHVGGRLAVPAGFLVTHPLQPHGPADLFGDERRLEPRVIGGGPTVGLRALHPDDADAIARQLEELGDAVAKTVGLHVVRVDGHLIVRRVGGGVRRSERHMALEWHLVLRLDDPRRALEGVIRGADIWRLRADRRRRLAHVVEQILRRRKRRRGGAVPGRLQRRRCLNGLLLTLADHCEIVAAPDDADEAGKILRPRRRRPRQASLRRMVV